MTVIERDEPWWEPDGTPTTSGPHPHYALWDHEGRKWDRLTDGVVLAGAERDALLAEVDRLKADCADLLVERIKVSAAVERIERARIAALVRGLAGVRGEDDVVERTSVLDIVEDRP